MKWEGGVEGTETHVPVLYVLEFELVVGALRYDGSAEGLYDHYFSLQQTHRSGDPLQSCTMYASV